MNNIRENEYTKIKEKKEKLMKKKEQCENEIKRIYSKLNVEKRKADTKRKIEKGGMIESFERKITGKQEETTKDEIAKFLREVFSKEEMKEKLKEITNEKLKEKIETEE